MASPSEVTACWQVIEAARRQGLTGELSLATAPTTIVYLRDGEVYFAERSTDSGLGVRLLADEAREAGSEYLDETESAVIARGPEGFEIEASFGAILLPDDAADPSQALQVADECVT